MTREININTFKKACSNAEICCKVDELYTQGATHQDYCDLFYQLEEEANSGVAYYTEHELNYHADLLELGIELNINIVDDTDQFIGDR